MKYDDPRIAKVEKLLDEAFSETKTIDGRTDNVYAGAQLRGFIKYFLPVIYSELKDGSRFEDLFPKQLEDLIKDVKNQEVMEKLKS